MEACCRPFLRTVAIPRLYGQDRELCAGNHLCGAGQGAAGTDEGHFASEADRAKPLHTDAAGLSL